MFRHLIAGLSALGFCACVSNSVENVAVDEAYVEVDAVELFENPERWDGRDIRTRAFAQLVGEDYKSQPFILLFIPDSPAAGEGGRTPCRSTRDPILVVLSEEAFRKVRGLRAFRSTAPLIEVEGWFSEGATRFARGLVSTIYQRELRGANVLAIKNDVCYF